jgi:hypothetical protein
MRVANVSLNSFVTSEPISSGGTVVDRVVTGTRVWAEVQIEFSDGDMIPTDVKEFECMFRQAFESKVVQEAFVSEIKRGRLIGGEV